MTPIMLQEQMRIAEKTKIAREKFKEISLEDIKSDIERFNALHRKKSCFLRNEIISKLLYLSGIKSLIGGIGIIGFNHKTSDFLDIDNDYICAYAFSEYGHRLVKKFDISEIKKISLVERPHKKKYISVKMLTYQQKEVMLEIKK